jgi:cytochrome b
MDAVDQAGAAAAVPRVRVWDLPTRLFHWVLAGTVVASVVSAKVGGAAMVWHFRLGYVVFTLLAFRIVWGFVGGRWSRFASFVRGPGTVLRYLKGEHRPDEGFEVGHNPLGALSVLGLLGWLALQVGTGLVSDDEIANIGPLNRFVSTDTGLAATSWHKSFGQWGLIALVVLHLAAIAYYLHRKKINLVRPMLHGDKALPPHVAPSRDDLVTRAAAAALVAGCAVLVTWIVGLGG